MQIWLPPSEGKHSPTSGPTLDLNTLSFPSLTPQRTRIISSLVALGETTQAAATLGLGKQSQADLALNSSLWETPCAPVENIFTGVLYNAANLPALTPEQHSRARKQLIIFSGLFGALTLGDLIPDHRLSMGVKLPSIGTVSTAWKPFLDETLCQNYRGEIIIDMRSGPYRSACPAQWAHLWQVGVVREKDGKRSVISHNAKYWRGLLTGYLLRLPHSHPHQETHSHLESMIASARELPAMTDTKGIEHRIRAIEFSELIPQRAGGSLRTITLVTD